MPFFDEKRYKNSPETEACRDQQPKISAATGGDVRGIRSEIQ